ncbi:MAG: hypothetical protein ACJ76J_07570 [Thermoanaerobaculia bacterium]
MTQELWTPDLDVAVHDDELIVRFDHLPPMEVDQVRAEMEDGGVVLYGGDEVHCFHVPLPEDMDLGEFDLRPYEGMFELRMHVQG